MEILMFLADNKLASLRLIDEYERHSNVIIGVDFDDTINDTFNRGHVNIPELVSMLKDLQTTFNCTLCVWTANLNEELVRTTWANLGLTIDYYNESPIKLFNPAKPYFNILLDDRAGLDSAFITLSNLYNYLLIKKEANVEN